MPAAEHTVISVLRGAADWLSRRGVDAPQRSAELLLGHVLGLDRLQLYLAHDRPLDEVERGAMRALLVRRGDGEPVAYLLGSWSFRGHELAVDRAVLVPRPETEALVDIALELAPVGARVVDLGTGSGAIALALAIERPDLAVTAVDVSENALAVARRNAAALGVEARVTFARGSWWEALDASGGAGEPGFDLVVSNPPYVDPDSPELAADVRAFEPPLALFAERGDPASCYRAIVAGLPRHLRPGGAVVLETGVGASAPALGVLQQSEVLTAVELRRDVAGIDRYLVARRAVEAPG
ncbi:MAG: peptide chain release factor N(5)-glutamine methyltransferase [Planctomycetes bacterium]|nr:peptide chain release factor N(5)-glutamine methyltransferase [Planctomycetota bacterium]